MTNRKKNIEFGIVLSLVLVIVSAYCQFTSTIPVIIALAITLLAPGIYTPFTRCWFRLGDLFGLVVTHCILFLFDECAIGTLAELSQMEGVFFHQASKYSDRCYYPKKQKEKNAVCNN